MSWPKMPKHVQQKAGRAARKVSPWGRLPAVDNEKNMERAKQWRESNS